MLKVSTGGREFTIELEKGDQPSGTINGKSFSLSMTGYGPNGFHILRNGKSYRAELVQADPEEKTFVIRVNNQKLTFRVQDKFDLLLNEMGFSASSQKKVNELKSPMPGLVLEILVKEGDTVNTGDQLLILEAMKMENVLKSPAAATVKKIVVNKGKAVEKNEVLILFE